MRRQAHRRNLVVWSQSVGSTARYAAPRLRRPARTRRIHWCIRTGAMIMIVGLMRLARVVRPWWRPLLAAAVLTGVGVVAAVVWGLVLLPGLLFLLSGALIPARPRTNGARRAEVEHGLAVFPHPAQRRLASQAIAVYDKRFPG